MRNIEIKARLHRPEDLERRLQDLGARFVDTLQQRDVFYAVDDGRLKLRFVNDDAELILYRRIDTPTLRRSEYERVGVEDGATLERILSQTLTAAGEVRKERRLYLRDNVRIHVDRVEGLGDFMEIEAVVDATHDEAQCQQVAQELLQGLGIRPADHESLAYIDLLRQASSPERATVTERQP